MGLSMSSTNPHGSSSLTTPSVELDTPFVDNFARRKIQAGIFHGIIVLCTLASLAVLGVLLYRVMSVGLPWLNLSFLTSFPSRVAARAGVLSALAGSVSIISITICTSVLLGVGAAIYLEELAPKSRWNRFVELNIANLSGVPSLVYGMLGLAVFVRLFGFGRSILAAAMTLSIMILPVLIISSREALRAVPAGIRLAAMALGATRWQTTWHHILPAAFPGILTGIILAISRALGEAAPLILVGGVTYIAFLPTSVFDSFTTLPIQIFNWAERPQEEFQAIAAAGIMVLLTLVLTTNAVAILLRARLENRNKW
jgi:phosphate transport system permease protein